MGGKRGERPARTNWRLFDSGSSAASTRKIRAWYQLAEMAQEKKRDRTTTWRRAAAKKEKQGALASMAPGPCIEPRQSLDAKGSPRSLPQPQSINCCLSSLGRLQIPALPKHRLWASSASAAEADFKTTLFEKAF